MPVLIRNETKCLFIHIPKTGGSSFENHAEAEGWDKIFSVNGIDASQLTYFKSTPQHLHAEILETIFNFEEFSETITLVRNPYDRFKSEYYWQRSTGITSIPPDEWISDSLNTQPKQPFLYDNHLRPQIEFIPSHCRIRIFKLEDNGIEKALEVLRLSDSSNSNRSPVRLFKKNVWNKKSTYLDKVERVFAEYRSVIETFYEKDYESLGYKRGGT